jgi:hypothetical protein
MSVGAFTPSMPIWNIDGKVTRKESGKPFSAEIYLIPQNGQNDLIQKIDDEEGRFFFPKVPQEDYNIVVKDLNDSKSYKIMILPKENPNELISKKQVDGISLEYQIHNDK